MTAETAETAETTAATTASTPDPASVPITGTGGMPRHYCAICQQVVEPRFRNGPGGRPDASCPSCGSLERHRFLAVLLGLLRVQLDDVDVLLEVAPSPETSPSLSTVGAKRHVRLDLGADNRLVDVLASLTEIPLADDSVDLAVCYHVLEHVPDDRAAMRELARVLAPGGIGLVQVPLRWGTTTDEDPDAPADERIRRFGQADHVRYYGDDFEQRLVECGLSVQRVSPQVLLGPTMTNWLHLMPHETVWVVRSRPVAELSVPGPDETSSLSRALEELFALWLDAEQRRVAQRDKVRRLQRRVNRLKTRLDRVEPGVAPPVARSLPERARGVAGGVVRAARARVRDLRG